MIQIRTTMPTPDGAITPEFRRDMAAAFARFMPDYHMHKGLVPYPVKAEDGPYVIDGNNNWWCRVDENDGQLITIEYRDETRSPGREFAFANWVISCRQGWEIVPASHAGNGVSLRVSVEFDVKLPRKFDADELSTISFEIPIEAVGVFIDSQLIPGAKVTGYETQCDVEVTS